MAEPQVVAVVKQAGKLVRVAVVRRVHGTVLVLVLALKLQLSVTNQATANHLIAEKLTANHLIAIAHVTATAIVIAIVIVVQTMTNPNPLGVHIPRGIQ